MAHDGRTRAGRLPAALADPRHRRVLLALAFAAACWLARTTSTPDGVLALVWPAAGVAFLWFASSWDRPRQVALDAGLALSELRAADGAGLEEMFLELTAHTQRDGAAA